MAEGLIGAIIGGALTFIAVLIQMGYQTKNEKRRFVIERLEQAYMSAAELRYEYKISFAQLAEFISQQKIDQVQKPDKVLSDHKLKMLISFYCPELVCDLKEIEKLIDDYFKKTMGVLHVLGKPDPNRAQFGVMITAEYEKLDNAIGVFQTKLSAHLHEKKLL